MGFPGGTEEKNLPVTARDTARSPGSRKWLPTPVFFPGKFRGQRSLEGYSPQGHKELDMTEHTCAHTHTHSHKVEGPLIVKTID